MQCQYLDDERMLTNVAHRQQKVERKARDISMTKKREAGYKHFKKLHMIVIIYHELFQSVII
jgi:hypothetical protein